MEIKVKKIVNLNDTFKIIMIYFITTVVSMIVTSFIVKYDFIKDELKNYLWVLIIFTTLFLILIRLLKVEYKSVLIFLGIIMFLLLFLLLNLDSFISIGTTPDDGIFPIMFLIALYTTLPFQSIINVLVGYDIGQLSYIIVPVYMLTLSLLCFISLKFSVKN